MSLLSSLRPKCVVRLPGLVEARRGIRFNDWAGNFEARAKEHNRAFLRHHFPTQGALRVMEPETPLFRVRLVRSPRNLPKRIRKSAETLGFGKDGTRLSGITRHKTVWVPQTALNAGRILKIKELVRVTLCTEAERREELQYNVEKKDKLKGYEVIGRATDFHEI